MLKLSLPKNQDQLKINPLKLNPILRTSVELNFNLEKKFLSVFNLTNSRVS